MTFKYLVLTIFLVSLIGTTYAFAQPDLSINTNTIVIKSTFGSNDPKCVEIQNGCFDPRVVDVDIGDIVIFFNADGASHTFTSVDFMTGKIGSVFDSGLLKPATTFEYQIKTNDDIDYFCTLHPWMKGLIIVGIDDRNFNPPPTVMIGFSPALAANDSWYLGEGLKQGDYFEYSLCHADYNDCREFVMDIWIKGETDTLWLAEVVVYDGNKIIRGDMELGKIAAEPINSSEVLEVYSNVFKNSVSRIAQYASLSNPTDFTVNSFQRICEGICPQMIPLGEERILIPAGVFKTQLIQWAINGEIWVLDDFPFPVKSLIFVVGSDNNIEYKFTLLDYYEDITSNPFEGVDDGPNYLYGITLLYPNWVEQVYSWHDMNLISDNELDQFSDYIIVMKSESYINMD